MYFVACVNLPVLGLLVKITLVTTIAERPSHVFPVLFLESVAKNEYCINLTSQALSQQCLDEKKRYTSAL